MQSASALTFCLKVSNGDLFIRLFVLNVTFVPCAVEKYIIMLT